MLGGAWLHPRGGSAALVGGRGLGGWAGPTLEGGSWCSRLPAGLSVLAGSHGFGPGTPGWAHGPLCPPPPCGPVQQDVSPMEVTSPSAWALALTPRSLGLRFFTVRRVGRVSTWFPGEMGEQGQPGPQGGARALPGLSQMPLRATGVGAGHCWDSRARAVRLEPGPPRPRGTFLHSLYLPTL